MPPKRTIREVSSSDSPPAKRTRHHTRRRRDVIPESSSSTSDPRSSSHNGDENTAAVIPESSSSTSGPRSSSSNNDGGTATETHKKSTSSPLSSVPRLSDIEFSGYGSEIEPSGPAEDPPVPTRNELATEASHALAATEGEEAIQFAAKDATLRMSLQVHYDADPALTCRVNYTARVHMTYNDNEEEGDKLRNEYVGYIEAWRISKPTARYTAGPGAAPWIAELLAYHERLAAKTHHYETAICMQALFNEAGAPRPKAGTRAQRDSLRDDNLLFVEMVYLRPKFQRKGLGRHIFDLWHRKLSDGTLPEWYCFSGNVVLVPSRPEGAKGASWGERTEQQIEGSLKKVYRAYGYKLFRASLEFSVINNDEEEEEWAMPVMGRPIP